MYDGIDGAVFVNALLSEICFGNTISLPTEFNTDNQSLADALNHPSMSLINVTGLKLEL